MSGLLKNNLNNKFVIPLHASSNFTPFAECICTVNK
jgi:hypothetical protein